MRDRKPDDQIFDLTGALLVAMPGMGDPRFDRSVVFMCAHSNEGAMGLIVNKPAHDLELGDMLAQLNITPNDDVRKGSVYFGGPVETSRGFVLHSDDYRSELKTLAVCGGFGMTATLDVLEALGMGTGPEHALVMLGYAGWGPGQLENEIAQNGWLTAQAHSDLVFDTSQACKWTAALATLGVDPLSLSGAAGRA